MIRFLSAIICNLLLTSSLSQDLGDYSIKKHSLDVDDRNGTFILDLAYEVGSSASAFHFTLFENDCKTEYTSEEVIKSSVPAVTDSAPNIVATDISIDTKKFQGSSLVAPTAPDGSYSSGDINFCVRFETMEGDISVTFHTERVKLSYDLTINNFVLSDIALTSEDDEVDDTDFGDTDFGDEEPEEPNKFINTTIIEKKCDCENNNKTMNVDMSDFVPELVVVVNTSQTEPKIFEEAPQAVSLSSNGDDFYLSVLSHSEDSTNPGALNWNILDLFCGIKPPAGLSSAFDTTTDSPTPAPNSETPLPITVTDFSMNTLPNGNFTMEIKANAVTRVNGKLYLTKHWMGASYRPEPPLLEILFARVYANEYKGSKIELEYISAYKVSACRCTSASFACIPDPTRVLLQNELLFVCVVPDTNDVVVSNLHMDITQGGEKMYTIATTGNNGPASTTLSILSKMEGKVRVGSRLITQLFSSTEDSVDVEGNAYLEFRANERRLGDTRTSIDRTLQRVPATKPAGNTLYSMNIKIEKVGASAVPTTLHLDEKSQSMIIVIIGGCLALMTVFVLFKKRMIFQNK